MILDELEYCSLFTYCPKSVTDKGLTAKTLMSAIKNERSILLQSGEEIFASEYIAKVLKVKKESFWSFSYENSILVPVPRSAPIKKDFLWPPSR